MLTRTLQLDNPKWLGWAKAKCRELDRLIGRDRDFAAKVYEPEAGTFVYLHKVDDVWKIRITGGGATGRFYTDAVSTSHGNVTVPRRFYRVDKGKLSQYEEADTTATVNYQDMSIDGKALFYSRFSGNTTTDHVSRRARPPQSLPARLLLPSTYVGGDLLTTLPRFRPLTSFAVVNLTPPSSSTFQLEDFYNTPALSKDGTRLYTFSNEPTKLVVASLANQAMLTEESKPRGQWVSPTQYDVVSSGLPTAVSQFYSSLSFNQRLSMASRVPGAGNIVQPYMGVSSGYITVTVPFVKQAPADVNIGDNSSSMAWMRYGYDPFLDVPVVLYSLPYLESAQFTPNPAAPSTQGFQLLTFSYIWMLLKYDVASNDWTTVWTKSFLDMSFTVLVDGVFAPPLSIVPAFYPGAEAMDNMWNADSTSSTPLISSQISGPQVLYERPNHRFTSPVPDTQTGLPRPETVEKHIMLSQKYQLWLGDTMLTDQLVRAEQLWYVDEGAATETILRYNYSHSVMLAQNGFVVNNVVTNFVSDSTLATYDSQIASASPPGSRYYASIDDTLEIIGSASPHVDRAYVDAFKNAGGYYWFHRANSSDSFVRTFLGSLAADNSLRMSPDGTKMWVKTTSQMQYYELGNLLLTLPNSSAGVASDAPPGIVAVTLVHGWSFASGKKYVKMDILTKSPSSNNNSITVQGGVVNIQGFGSFAVPNNPSSPTDGFQSIGGVMHWISIGGFGFDWTEATLSAAFGAPTTFVPNGVFYQISTPPPPLVPSTVYAHFDAVSGALKIDKTLSATGSVPSRGPLTETVSGASVLYTEGNLVQDEFIPSSGV